MMIEKEKQSIAIGSSGFEKLSTTLMPNLKFKFLTGSKIEALIISASMETSVSAMN